MATLEYLLLGYLIIWPLYSYLTYEQEIKDVIAQPKKRISVYYATMFQLWLPVLMLFILVYLGGISMSDIGLQWHWGLANQVAVIGLLIISSYFLLSLKQLRKKLENHQAIREQISYIQWLMPTSMKEARFFIWGLSITAGICEELLFRGYLILLLSGYLPTYGTVILSSIAFGLLHIYQGPIHIIKTAIFGGVMALIYLGTDSILVPIILHAVLDMYGGAMAYIVYSDQSQEMRDGKVNEC